MKPSRATWAARTAWLPKWPDGDIAVLHLLPDQHCGVELLSRRRTAAANADDQSQLRRRVLRDRAGRRVGRIVAVESVPATSPHTWYLVRLSIWNELRAVPAIGARCEDGGVTITLDRGDVFASPRPARVGRRRGFRPVDVKSHYAAWLDTSDGALDAQEPKGLDPRPASC